MNVSRAGRAAGLSLCLWLVTALSGAGAQAGTPALVVDLGSGKVLHAENATDPWYPASITKLMTTYVALEMVRDGRASMNTLLTLSAAAAAQPPSKMGFKPGTQITLENALKIIMVKSANDLAMMIGENLGGSVDGFAVMMNDAAHRLGMRESRWYNPNGLPDERQQTSARDMAILARALLREFPEQESLFHIGAVQLGRNVMRNHNGMLGRYPGADGMKTGFICAGGFNIVATATQGGRRLITIVMGYPSARERDLRAADLFDEGFQSSGGWGGQRLEDLPPSNALSPPNMRPIVCGPHKRQPEEDDEQAVIQARQDSGNSENGGIAALFSPLTFASPATGGAPALGRRTLGPRVAFEPIPVFLGPSPGSTPDAGDDVKAQTVRIAQKPVRTKLLSRNAAGGKLPSTAAAFTDTPTGANAGPASVDVVKTVTRPGGRDALQSNLAPQPTAETKPREARPRLGAVGGGLGRTGLGAIPARSSSATAVSATAVSGASEPAPEGVNPAPSKTAADGRARSAGKTPIGKASTKRTATRVEKPAAGNPAPAGRTSSPAASE